MELGLSRVGVSEATYELSPMWKWAGKRSLVRRFLQVVAGGAGDISYVVPEERRRKQINGLVSLG